MNRPDTDLNNVDQGPEGVFLIHEEESDSCDSVETLQKILANKRLTNILPGIYAGHTSVAQTKKETLPDSILHKYTTHAFLSLCCQHSKNKIALCHLSTEKA